LTWGIVSRFPYDLQHFGPEGPAVASVSAVGGPPPGAVSLAGVLGGSLRAGKHSEWVPGLNQDAAAARQARYFDWDACPSHDAVFARGLNGVRDAH
jgi:hypothetical protein